MLFANHNSIHVIMSEPHEDWTQFHEVTSTGHIFGLERSEKDFVYLLSLQDEHTQDYILAALVFCKLNDLRLTSETATCIEAHLRRIPNRHAHLELILDTVLPTIREFRKSNADTVTFDFLDRVRHQAGGQATAAILSAFEWWSSVSGRSCTVIILGKQGKPSHKLLPNLIRDTGRGTYTWAKTNLSVTFHTPNQTTVAEEYELLETALQSLAESYKNRLMGTQASLRLVAYVYARLHAATTRQCSFLTTEKPTETSEVFNWARDLVNDSFLSRVHRVAMTTFKGKIRDAIAVGVLDIGTGTLVWIAVDTLDDGTQFIRVLSRECTECMHTPATVRVKDAEGVFWKRSLEFCEGWPMRCISVEEDSVCDSDYDYHQYLAVWPNAVDLATSCRSSP